MSHQEPDLRARTVARMVQKRKSGGDYDAPNPGHDTKLVPMGQAHRSGPPAFMRPRSGVPLKSAAGKDTRNAMTEPGAQRLNPTKPGQADPALLEALKRRKK